MIGAEVVCRRTRIVNHHLRVVLRPAGFVNSRFIFTHTFTHAVSISYGRSPSSSSRLLSLADSHGNIAEGLSGCDTLISPLVRRSSRAKRERACTRGSPPKCG